MSYVLYQEMRNVESDLEVLADAFFNSLCISDCEYGAIGLDCKRPFGNSDVDRDILEMIGVKPDGVDGCDDEFSDEQRNYANSLYHEKLIPYLQKKWRNHEQSGKVIDQNVSLEEEVKTAEMQVCRHADYGSKWSIYVAQYMRKAEL